MKKHFILLLVLILSAANLFAAVPIELQERVFVFNGEQATTMNLANTFYLPTYAVEWEAKSNDLVNGTYITKAEGGKTPNGIGHIGCVATSHRIIFEVDTNGGKFVSQSDPSKYRDYYVAMKPRIRDYKAKKDCNYYIDPKTGVEVNHSDRIPNTRETNHVTCYAPAMKSLYNAAGTAEELTEDKKVYSGSQYGNIYPMRSYFDVLLGFDPLTSQDKIHLADLDDYLAEITITWHCDHDGECDVDCHRGSFVFTIRGLYNASGNEKDDIFMIITPQAAASRLDIRSLINNNEGIGREHIADMEIVTTIKTGSVGWDSNIMVFLSASPTATSQNAEGFRLKRYFPSDDGTYIPFKVNVYNLGFENSAPNRSYDGTNVYTNKAQSKNMCLQFNQSIIIDGTQYSILRSTYDRQGKTATSLIYQGVVDIEIDDHNHDILNNIEDYRGIYRGNIYYHIIYAK